MIELKPQKKKPKPHYFRDFFSIKDRLSEQDKETQKVMKNEVNNND